MATSNNSTDVLESQHDTGGVEGCPRRIATSKYIPMNNILSIKRKGLLSRDMPVDNFFAHYDTIRGVLISCQLSPNQADVVMMVLRLHLISGVCFASARYLGGVCLSEKGVDRLVKKLSNKGLLKKKRILRPNGTLGTNVLNPSPLLQLLKKALGRLLNLPKVAAWQIKQRVQSFYGGCSVKWHIHWRDFHMFGEGWLNLLSPKAAGC